MNISGYDTLWIVVYLDGTSVITDHWENDEDEWIDEDKTRIVSYVLCIQEGYERMPLVKLSDQPSFWTRLSNIPANGDKIKKKETL